MKKDIITSAIAVVVLTVLLGILYPLLITGVSQVAFPGNANGQKVYVNGQLVGSKIIGQAFVDQVYKNGKPVMQSGNPVTVPDPRYFQSRPSGTAPADNAAGSAFANYGPNSTVTLAAIQSNIQSFIALNGKYYPGGLTAAKVPVDAADTSASGIDPDISEAYAQLQAHRVAAVRRLPLTTVQKLISENTDGRSLGFFGESGVNVLELNLALDKLGGTS